MTKGNEQTNKRCQRTNSNKPKCILFLIWFNKTWDSIIVMNSGTKTQDWITEGVALLVALQNAHMNLLYLSY